MIHVTEIIDIDDAVVAAFDRLVPQLSKSSLPPDVDALTDIAGNPNSLLLAAKDTETGTIVGTLTLAFYRIPTGLQARIEDVIVDGDARGRGVGALLTEVAIDKARAAGAKTVGLTSRPSREAANRLYTRLGFEQRETNVYRYRL
ncbi:Streptothricin acetyltransferase, Streptomyces lavendulae type [hydrothermal vent metagenome]|uniref:Streptothricin acetyltransferase, Streptomyces lavendulae type n=1 Tax=hydrothermal vent metagenome TaxID=652676 RepID=A0A3B0SSS1_9ZZZZ